MPFTWTDETAPFFDLDDGMPARFILEQVDDGDFRLQASFRYCSPSGQPAIDVTATTLGDTDLASIPRFMSWFVSRHGRHTPAALVHDQLITSKATPDERIRADRMFLEAMDCLGAPPVRSRVMWSAVALGTRSSTRPWGLLSIIAWALSAVAGIALLIYGLVTLTAWPIVVALLGPLVGAAFWGREYWAGVIGGYALPLVALPAIASLLGYWVYWLVEQVVRFGRWLLPHNRQPHAKLARPTKFREA